MKLGRVKLTSDMIVNYVFKNEKLCNKFHQHHFLIGKEVQYMEYVLVTSQHYALSQTQR